MDPVRFLLIALSGWMNQQQLQLIDYLRHRNGLATSAGIHHRGRSGIAPANEYLAAEKPHPARQNQGSAATIRRRENPLWPRLPAGGGRKAVAEVAVVASPDTILRGFRKLVARKFDGSRWPQTVGRPRVGPSIENLIVRMARENPAWG